MGQLMFSSAEPLVSLSPSPEDELEWMIRVVSWPSSFFDLLADSAPAGSSGKTFPVRCHLATETISETFSARLLTQGMGWRGESWTLRGSEYPNVDVDSSLSDILETGDLPSRFYLSARACEGILRRAEVRGRTLPPQLAAALQHWAAIPALSEP